MQRFLLFILLLCANLLFGQERFLDWQTEITPRADRSIEVREALTVRAEGEQIKRGITRTLPSTGENPLEVVSVERDGAPSAYHLREGRGVQTIYVGEADQRLATGTYTYRLTYRIGNAVVARDEADELQVEVIGPDVDFPVEQATASIRLPEGLAFLRAACYTGTADASRRDCTQTAPDSGRITFTGTETFGRGKQFSVAAGFAPGYFTASAPAVSGTARTSYAEPVPVWRGRGTVWAVIIGTIFAFAYAYRSWKQYGVDPDKPRVGSVFAPPQQLSPGALAYVNAFMGEAGSAAFTATVLHLATRGYLTIDEEEEKGIFSTDYLYVLRATRPAPPLSALSAEQRRLYEKLFDGREEIRLEEKYDKKIQKIAKQHQQDLKANYENLRSVDTNGWKVLPLVGIYLLAVIPAALLLHDDTTGYGKAAFIAFAAAAFFGLLCYAWLIRRPSPELVRLRTEISAFKNYLGLSEEKRKRLLNAPSMNHEHYEDLLPYAIALGINTRWSEYYEDILTPQHYQPVWMAGTGMFNPSRFDNSFSKVIQTSSTPPGSAGSASAGGGSVGGGVGGGGAGGW